ncbi:MAG: hypothetical protein ABEJ73_02555 [Haloplanus sp.]
MDSHTLLTIGFVVLAASAVFLTVHAGAVAIGVLPTSPGVRDANGDVRDADGDAESAAETDENDADERRESRITADDRERMRQHLEKDHLRRTPDDLLPSDADDDGS